MWGFYHRGSYGLGLRVYNGSRLNGGAAKVSEVRGSRTLNLIITPQRGHPKPFSYNCVGFELRRGGSEQGVSLGVLRFRVRLRVEGFLGLGVQGLGFHHGSGDLGKKPQLSWTLMFALVSWVAIFNCYGQEGLYWGWDCCRALRLGLGVVRVFRPICFSRHMRKTPKP